MGIFDYNHSKKNIFKNNLISDIKKETTEEEAFYEPLFVVPDDTTNTQITTVNNLKSIFNNKYFISNPIFDSSLESDIGIFQNFISSHYPRLEDYLSVNPDGFNKISFRAFIDARDYLINEFGETPGDLLDVNLDINGKNINYREVTVKNNGKVYKNNEVIFDPSEPCTAKVSEIDFEKMSVTVEPGLIIPFSYLLDLTDHITNRSNFTMNTDSLLGTSNDDLLLDTKNNAFYNNLIANNNELENKEIKKLDFAEDLTVDELFAVVGITNYEDKLRSFVLSPEIHQTTNLSDSITVCNLKELNFMFLLLLIIIGGGKEGKFPVGSAGNQVVTSDLSGCSRADVNTHHPMLWSNSKKQGVPISALQLLAPVVDLVKKVNIPEVSFMGWRVFRGICVLGHLHIALIKFQGKISEIIRDAFKCEIKITQPVRTKDGYGFSLKTTKTETFNDNNPVKNFISLTNAKDSSGNSYIDKDGSAIDSIITVMANGQIPLDYVVPEKEDTAVPIPSIYYDDSDAPNIDSLPYFIASFVYTDSSKKTGTISFDDFKLAQAPKYKNVLVSDLLKSARYEIIPLKDGKVVITINEKKQTIALPKIVAAKTTITSAELARVANTGQRFFFNRLVRQRAYIRITDGYTYTLSEDPVRISLPVANGKFRMNYYDGYQQIDDDILIEDGYFVKFNAVYLISKTKKV